MTPQQPRPTPGWSRRSVLALLGAAPWAVATATPATAHAAIRAASQPDGAMDARIEEIIGRPEFAGSHWGMRFSSTRSGEAVYELNPAELFNAGSTFKVFHAGTAFAALGADHRFRTRVYRTGPLVKGVLKGDLVLVAGGDLLLAGRIRRDGSLELPEPDHSYDKDKNAGPVLGDPLTELRKLARQVAAGGVRRVEGRVLVDTSLFRESRAKLPGGQEIPISPMMINDNLVDVTVRPGSAAGAPAALEVSPQTGYLHIVNDVTTVPADTANPHPLSFTGPADNPDGTHSVTLTGDVPLGVPKLFRAYPAPSPSRFAGSLFTDVLRDEGVQAEPGLMATPDFARLASHYKRGNEVAGHVSPPLPDELKVMLKVSSNIHTAMWPYLIGAIATGDGENAKAAGLELQAGLFAEAGLEARPPGAAENRYTPEFFTRFLTYMSHRPYYRKYRLALPILGKDGPLTDIETDSPAAGHVFAKTGTSYELSAGTASHVNKALAGFVELPDGHILAFGAFAQLPLPDGDTEPAAVVARALGEIAAAVYETISSHSGTAGG